MFLAQYLIRWSEQGGPMGGEQQGFLGNGQSVFRIMGVHNSGYMLFPAQAFNGLQHNKLVPEVQVGFRLIQHQNGWICSQRPGNKHHLQFSAADVAA